MEFDENVEDEASEMKILTEEGFMETGRIMEDILEEVIAFAELDEKFGGTDLTNDTQHHHLSHHQTLRSQSQANENDLGRNEIPENVPENEEMALLGGTVPPDLHPSQGGPPDRGREMNAMRF